MESNFSNSIEQISILLKSYIPLIWVNTYEEDRFIKNLHNEITHNQNKELWEWSSYKGLIRYEQKDNTIRASGEMDKTWNPSMCLEAIIKYKRNESKKGSIFVLKDFHTVLVQPLPRMLRDMYSMLIKDQKTIIIVAPFLAYGGANVKHGLEPTLEKQITVVNYELPQKDYIEKRIKSSVNHMKKYNKKNIKTKLDYTDEEYSKFATAVQGLTELEIDNAIIGCLSHLQRIDEKQLLLEKKQIIQRSDILEYIDCSSSIDDVGGLDLVKKYFNSYNDQFSEEAKAFGVEPLKAVLLLGVPGTGKSKLAKIVSSMWSLPLLRLDIGRIMDSLIGASIRWNEEIVWFDSVGRSYRDTIENLVNKSPDNCYVWTYTDEGEAKLGKVSSFIKHRRKNDLYRIKVSGNREITITEDHCVFTHDERLNLKSTTIDQLKVGDYIALPKMLPTIPDSRCNGTWDEGFIAGAWLGDGDYNGKDLRLHLNIKDIDSFSQVFKRLNINFSIYNNSSSDQCKAVHLRNNWRERLETLGFTGDCYTKRVPESIYGMSLSYIKGLLCGYFSTDGSINKHVVENSSASYSLSKDIINLLHYVGIYGFIGEKASTCSQFKTNLDYYTRIQISGLDDLILFAKEITFIQSYKQNRLEEYINNHDIELAHGVYIPNTEVITDELCLLRRTMWNSLGRRNSIDINQKVFGTHVFKKFLNYDYPVYGKDNLVKYNAPTLRKAVSQEIRWIKIENIEKIVDLNEKDEFVYDLSVPGTGIEKFIAGNPFFLVHNSESRMRQAISQVEAISPAILWLDEIEKALSGVSSSSRSDGGTTSRVFGTLLTAMEEGMKNVILIATSNDIQALPPELIRRFNEVFYVDLPYPGERREIFNIHLKKRNRDPKKLNLDMDKLIEATHSFTGSEIEKVIKESIAIAFRQKEKDINTDIILRACNETKPIAKVMKEKIDAIRDWAKSRARYASSVAETENNIVPPQQENKQFNFAQFDSLLED